MRSRASNLSTPTSCGGTREPASVPLAMVPSGAMITGIGSLCRIPTSKSLGSWAGVIFTTPVPNAGSTYESAITGISTFAIGSITDFPTSFA